MAPEKRESVRIFDPHTGAYRAAKAADRDLVAEHEAQAAGEPAPGDRTEAELREMEPAMAGPVATAAGPGEPDGGAATPAGRAPRA